MKTLEEIKEWANDPLVCIHGTAREVIDTLTALCDGYRGDIDRLAGRLVEYKREAQKSCRREDASKEARDRAESKVKELESALTRARAEAMEEAEKIAAEMPTPGYADDSKRDGYEAAKEDIAAAVRARAAKGDSDEG